MWQPPHLLLGPAPPWLQLLVASQLQHLVLLLVRRMLVLQVVLWQVVWLVVSLVALSLALSQAVLSLVLLSQAVLLLLPALSLCLHQPNHRVLLLSARCAANRGWACMSRRRCRV